MLRWLFLWLLCTDLFYSWLGQFLVSPKGAPLRQRYCWTRRVLLGGAAFVVTVFMQMQRMELTRNPAAVAIDNENCYKRDRLKAKTSFPIATSHFQLARVVRASGHRYRRRGAWYVAPTGFRMLACLGPDGFVQRTTDTHSRSLLDGR